MVRDVIANDTINLAMQRHQAGKLEEAESLYRQVLDEEPANPQALHLLGLARYQRGQFDEAVELIERAIAIEPGFADFYCNLGLALAGQKRFDDAAAAYRKSLSLEPLAHETQYNLGNALRDLSKPNDAIAAYQHALSLRPNHLRSYNNMASVLRSLGRLDESIAAYQRAIAIAPDYFDALNNLGNALRDKGDNAGAITVLRRAVTINPRRYETQLTLANTLLAAGNVVEAIATLQKAVEQFPDSAHAHNDLGFMLLAGSRLDEAKAEFIKAIELLPDYFAPHSNLAFAWQLQGELELALKSYERSLALKPDMAAVASNRLYLLHLLPDHDPRAVLQEHLAWAKRFAEPLREKIRPHKNDRSPERRLRIGYVSPDFRRHVVGWNMLPLLSTHDHAQFEIFCYSNIDSPDGLTAHLRSLADQWRDIRRLNDDEAAELIRQDMIDILVDLSLHTAGNRLLVFARKPAPIQISYLGHTGTTGMAAMDYRLSDPYFDPPNADTSYYVEETIRLADCYWCYQPSGQTPEVSESPGLANGYVTFGCMANFAKVSPAALELWQELLLRVPRSRLVLYCPAQPKRAAVIEAFAAKGIAAERLEFADPMAFERFVLAYHRIDIALDTFPVGGGITTCDSLWMGVPVVSLAGRTAAGRGGLSVLSNVGLGELVAKTPEQYLSIARKLASDIPGLAEMRRTLRQGMLQSPLTDGRQFAKNVEKTYRDLWRKWTVQSAAGNQGQA
jgi:predicted O-linked N-acetylglucosamine transferase (SPINDLY family)